MTVHGPVLRDIHLPPAAWWPPAPGWWWLAVVVVLVAAGIAWWSWHRARLRPVRAVLREIDALESAFLRSDDVERLVDDASRLLRRVACRIDRTVAADNGSAWRTFLHRHARDAAVRRALDGLVETRFHAVPAVDVPMLLTALRRWCRDALLGRAAVAARVEVSRPVRQVASP